MIYTYTITQQRGTGAMDIYQQAEEASKVFEAQAEEATRAMSEDLPDLEGAEI